MRYTHKPPPVAALIRGMRGVYKAKLYRGAQAATDKAIRAAHARVRLKMAGSRLGRLGNAVGVTSSLTKRQTPKNPYGVIFAKDGPESRSAQALEAYSTGVTIKTRNRQWLAFATDAVGKRLGRRRMTPELYNKSGLVNSIGPLVFVPLSPWRAMLVVRNVTLHPRTYRAKAAGPRAPRTRVAAKQVVAFVLIRVTRRAQRFDKDREIAAEARNVPFYLSEFMEAP